MGKKCLNCEQVCVYLFLFIPAACIVPCISVTGIVLASMSLDLVTDCYFRGRSTYYYDYYRSCDRSLFIAGFSFLIVISICACQISCCVVYAKLRESSWRKNKLNQPITNQPPQTEDYFAGITPRTPPPSYTTENERARIIPNYNQAIL